MGIFSYLIKLRHIYPSGSRRVLDHGKGHFAPIRHPAPESSASAFQRTAARSLLGELMLPESDRPQLAGGRSVGPMLSRFLLRFSSASLPDRRTRSAAQSRDT